ncbi:MAG TPA: elongation factor P [Verrucomicrobia bacterium]|nr:elongation factor P [Verrucomicrobiota bacterium]
MSFTAADLRKGLKIELEGIPYEVTEFEFCKPGKGQAMYKCRIKNMLIGTTMEKTFRAVDKIDQPNIESKTLSYSYQEGDKYVFMDNKTYEQVELHEDVLGDQRFFLLPDLECEVLFFNGRAMTVTLPAFVIKEIIDTEPGARGNTATNVLKPAKIDTGFEIGVPIFINRGDFIRIDTRTGKYVERVKQA